MGTGASRTAASTGEINRRVHGPRAEGEIRMIITPDEMCKYIIKLLHESVADLPEDRREDAMEKILNAFSGYMFQGPKEKPE